MTEAARKRIVLASARNVRRMYRRADTAGEIVERWLDRQISRKTRIQPSQFAVILPKWEVYRDMVVGIERAVIDFLRTANI